MMEDLFRSFWWLLFPLAWIIVGGWDSWLKYRNRQATLDLIKTYAQNGRDVPAELLEKLKRRTRTGG